MECRRRRCELRASFAGSAARVRQARAWAARTAGALRGARQTGPPGVLQKCREGKRQQRGDRDFLGPGLPAVTWGGLPPHAAGSRLASRSRSRQVPHHPQRAAPRTLRGGLRSVCVLLRKESGARTRSCRVGEAVIDYNHYVPENDRFIFHFLRVSASLSARPARLPLRRFCAPTCCARCHLGPAP